jgi:hypothetical protein
VRLALGEAEGGALGAYEGACEAACEGAPQSPRLGPLPLDLSWFGRVGAVSPPPPTTTTDEERHLGFLSAQDEAEEEQSWWRPQFDRSAAGGARGRAALLMGCTLALVVGSKASERGAGGALACIVAAAVAARGWGWESTTAVTSCLTSVRGAGGGRAPRPSRAASHRCEGLGVGEHHGRHELPHIGAGACSQSTLRVQGCFGA